MDKIRCIDLFGGIGGFRYGLEQSSNKYKFVWYCDIDKYAVSVYNKNYGEKYEAEDIRKIKTSDIPEFDMLCAGFPCQSFSIAGKRKGLYDTRGTLFYEITRIIKDKKPKIIFLENVKGLLNHNKGKTFTIILKELETLGYNIEWVVLNSRFFRVPQSRERLYIIGYTGKINNKILPTGKKRNLSNPYTKNIDIPDEVRYLSDKKKDDIIRCMKYANTLDTSGYIRRLGGWNGMSLAQRTLRRLTPIECERLQGFPDNWTKKGFDAKKNKEEDISDAQRYKQCGNSVTTTVITEIGKKLDNGIKW